MEPGIAAVVLFSAMLHPLWNALIKREKVPEGAFVGLIALVAVIAAGQAFLMGTDLLAAAAVWEFLAISWAAQVFYGVALVATLRRGDLSANYPIIRSTPMLIVIVGVVFLGERYSWPLLAGIALVLVGAFLLQHRPGRRLLDDPRTLLLAIVALISTTAYSIADSRAMRQIEPVVLMFWVHAMTAPTFLLAFRAVGGPEVGWRDLFAWVGRPVRSLALAAICYLSYYLILVAFEWGGDVAAVTAVRQASIPFSVLIGGLWLKEAALGRRLWASLVLTSGITVIVLVR